MYVEGIVTAVEGYKAKIKVPEFDMETEFLSVPQLFTVKNKSGFKPEIGALVAAVLSDDMTYGAIIGQIYNDEDMPPDSEDAEFIQFSDGVSISHIPGTKTLTINAEDIIVNSNISCSKDIKDKTNTMQEMRDIYNSHIHIGNLGASTSAPYETMGG